MGCVQSTEAGKKQTKNKSKTQDPETKHTEQESNLITIYDSVDWKYVLTNGVNKDYYVSFVTDYLQSCLCSKNEVYVIDVICTSPEDILPEVARFYLETYSRNLSDVIQDVCCSEVADILCAMLKKEEKPVIDTESMSTQMVESITENNLFDNDKLFQNCLKHNNRCDVQALLEQFLRKCQRDMCVEIEKKFPDGKEKEGYLTFAQLIRMPHLYLAEKINDLLSSEEVEKQRHLAFIILSQNEENLKSLKKSYQTAHFELLSAAVRETVTDSVLKNSLLSALDFAFFDWETSRVPSSRPNSP